MAENYVRVGRSADVPPGKMRCAEVDGVRILLANVDGTIFAADDTCTHEDASLCTGALQDHYVKCPLHGSRFDLRTGDPQEDPAEIPLRVYPVKVQDGDVLVEWD
jgi:nitrite reductase/ring-hydroxylating ferredoxin subunit